jgi:WD40 repeat protein
VSLLCSEVVSCLTPRDNIIAALTDFDLSIHIIDADTLEPLRDIDLGEIDHMHDMKMSPDGECIFVSTETDGVGKISYYGLYSADQVDSPPFSECIRFMTIAPHGRHLVAGFCSGQLFLVEASSLNSLLEVRLTSRSPLEILCIEYLPSGRQVVAMAKECVHLVDADSMVPVRTLDMTSTFISYVASRNDRGEDCLTCLFEENKIVYLRFTSLVALDEVDFVHVIPFEILCLAWTSKHLAFSGVAFGGAQGYVCLLDYPSLLDNPSLQMSALTELPLEDPRDSTFELVFVTRSCTLVVAVELMGVFVLEATHLTILYHSGNLWSCLDVARPWKPFVPPPPQGANVIMMVAAEWEVYVHPLTGQILWWNPRTDRVSWSDPNVLGDGAV